MGRSTDAILAYGYDLGSDENDEWSVREVDEYGSLKVPWFDLDVEEDLDFSEAITDQLLAVAGFTEEDDGSASYYERREAALDSLGVQVISHCSDTVPMYVLAAASLEASRGNPQDATALLAADEVTRREWDERLAAVLAGLGLTPVADKPVWLLCSYADGFNA